MSKGGKLRITGSLSKIRINSARYTRDLDRSLRRVHKEAIRAFVQAGAPRVPVLTGETRGTWVPLGRKVGELITIAPTERHPRRNPTSGIPFTDIEIDAALGKYRFVFQVDLRHYGRNYSLDITAGRSPTSPWESFSEGKKAYKSKLKELLKTIPKINRYISYSRVTPKGEQNGE